MTTLTPEKEAELRDLLEKACAPEPPRSDTREWNAWASAFSIYLKALEDAAPDLLATLSTERQARDAVQSLLADRSTELDWERSARQAAEQESTRQLNSAVEWFDKFKTAEKEVERLKLVAQNRERAEERHRMAKEVADIRLAEMVEVVQKCKRQFEFYTEQHLAKTPPDDAKGMVNQRFADLCHDALSALPPPVPTEEAGPKPVKHTLTINNTEEEMVALEKLAAEKDLKPWTIFRHALRVYQLYALPEGHPERVGRSPTYGADRLATIPAQCPGCDLPADMVSGCGSPNCYWKANCQAPQDVAQPLATGGADALMKGTPSLPQEIAGEPRLCRRCGKLPVIHENDWTDPPEWSAWCECPTAFASRDEAVAAWNRRIASPPQDVAGLVEGVERLFRLAPLPWRTSPDQPGSLDILHGPGDGEGAGGEWGYVTEYIKPPELAEGIVAVINRLPRILSALQGNDHLEPAAADNNHKALVEAVAELDAAEKSCPAANGKLGGRECPKCGAGLGQNCGPSLRRMDSVIRAAKALAAEWKS